VLPFFGEHFFNSSVEIDMMNADDAALLALAERHFKQVQRRLASLQAAEEEEELASNS
jgi:hypothetical protein